MKFSWRLLIVILLAVVGLAVWLLAVAIGHRNPWSFSFVTYVPVMLGLGVVIGFLNVRPSDSMLAVVLPQLAAAMVRGSGTEEDDGVWATILFVIMFWNVVMWLIALTVQRLRARPSQRRVD